MKVRRKGRVEFAEAVYNLIWRDSKSDTFSTPGGRGDRFRYDDEGQLVEAWYNAADPANSGAGNNRYDGFSYDELGNHENRVGSNFVASRGLTSFYRRDTGLNEYASWSPSAFWYDGGGVMGQDGWITLPVNSLNQPIWAWAPAYAGASNLMWFGYDPLGRCVKRWVSASGSEGTNPATYFYYEGWNLIQEGPSYNSASRNYIHGARVDEIVKQITPGNWWERYFQYDARGHCTLQTDASGNINEQYEYDAFGYPYFFDGSGNPIGSYDAHGVLRGYSPWGNRFLFTGREYLSELALYDYRNRMYQPELGRFLQPDPKEFAAGDYNLYRYCHNDPVNRTDPFGLEFTDLGYGFSNFVPGADYGITQPVLTAPQIILTPVSGGYTASVPKIDLTVRSTIATKARDGQTVFNRKPENIERTVKHEGDHREHSRGWYDKNHEKVLRDLNTDKVYKDPAAAKSAVEQKLRNSYENFRKQEDTHTGPNWPNYKRPDREQP